MNYFSNQLQQSNGTPFVNTGVITPQTVDISEAAFAARDRDPFRVALTGVGNALKERKDKMEKKADEAAEEGGKAVGIFSKLFGG